MGSLPPAGRFQDLVVWQKSHQLVLRVYRLTKDFPKHETYGLVAQMRKAAVSVPANVAEGFKRRGRADKARVMNIAQASRECQELRYYFILAHDLDYTATELEKDLTSEVARMLEAYTKTLHSPVS